MSDLFDPVIEELELLIAESAQLMAGGPHFQVAHRFRRQGTICQAGEEIYSVWLVHRSRQFQLRLPLALRILFDYLARHRWLLQSSAQIESGIRADDFYAKHGANASISKGLTRRISHSAVREYIKRIRRALRVAFDEAGLNLDPSRVLVSEPMVSNEVGYRLKATVTWSHVE